MKIDGEGKTVMNIQNRDRRRLLQAGGALATLAAVGFISPAAFADWNKAAFEGKSIDDAMKALGASSPASSGDIQIIASDIAENGAVVPIQMVSRIANTQQIALMIEKNPNVLGGIFDVGPDLVPDFTTRVKMGQTSNIFVLVKADGKFFVASKEIKVTLGGCGG
jgi:sulfur-oxidizing protein SoxY